MCGVDSWYGSAVLGTDGTGRCGAGVWTSGWSWGSGFWTARGGTGACGTRSRGTSGSGTLGLSSLTSWLGGLTRWLGAGGLLELTVATIHVRCVECEKDKRRDLRDLLHWVASRGGRGWGGLLSGHDGGAILGVTAARLGDGNRDGRWLGEIRVADGAVLDGHSVSLRNMAWTRCPCRCWLRAALSDGVCHWHGTGFAE